MNPKLKTLALTLGAVALLAPAASAGKPSDKRAKGKSETKAKAHGKKAKNAVFRGTVVSVDAEAGSLVVDVTSASKWGRAAVGNAGPETFTVGEATKVKVHDLDGNGTADLTDFQAGHRVHVLARVAKDQDLAQPIAARKVDNKTAKEADAGGETAAQPAE